MKVLIVEDELKLQKTISSYLRKEGFECDGALNYASAKHKVINSDYDIVILDITLPDGNGINLLEFIKAENLESGVLILSAKNSIDDKLKGLDLGADDYLTKPFHLSELNSRIRAVIRRRNYNGFKTIKFNEFEIDPEAKVVTISGKLLDLTKNEYAILLYFIVNKNRVITKEAIASHLSTDNISASFNYDNVYTHIKNIRRKIDETGGVNYLKSIYGLGYKYTDQ